MQELLFSYGTLQKDNVQLELFGRLLQGHQDVLQGYQLSTIEIKDESVLVKSEQPYHLIALPAKDTPDTIEGIVFTISKEELLLADNYETDDYKRIKVKLQSGKEAWVYVAV
jgi:gamma-glutamylcyclotransferase (GGCT)/AIG2-like uncharacterized protein YtfP